MGRHERLITTLDYAKVLQQDSFCQMSDIGAQTKTSIRLTIKRKWKLLTVRLLTYLKSVGAKCH